MEKINSLSQKLSKILDWNQAHIDFLSKFIVAFLNAETVNLMKIAPRFQGPAKPKSHYKRIIRFLQNFDLDFDQIARVVTGLIALPEKWILCMDRTTWEFGKLTINILVLAVAYKGAAIPILWTFLPKKGNSDTQERIDLMKRFLKIFGSEKISCLTADREFIGREWVSWLIENKIPFRIRIKKNTQVRTARGAEERDVYRYFEGLRLGESWVLRKKRRVWGIQLHLVGLKTSDDYVILITDHDPKEALADYMQRWQIETLFGCLKTRGFNMEDTHLEDFDKISKLLALMAITFCWCYLVGEWQNQVEPLKIKKHGRLEMGLFRYGLDFLINVLANLEYKMADFQRALEILTFNLEPCLLFQFKNPEIANQKSELTIWDQNLRHSSFIPYVSDFSFGLGSHQWILN